MKYLDRAKAKAARNQDPLADMEYQLKEKEVKDDKMEKEGGWTRRRSSWSFSACGLRLAAESGLLRGRHTDLNQQVAELEKIVKTDWFRQGRRDRPRAGDQGERADDLQGRAGARQRARQARR